MMTTKTFDISDVNARAAFVEAMIEAGGVTNITRLENSTWTVGLMFFPDGWSVQGKAVCVNPADYSMEIGVGIIRKNCITEAETHYWRTAGYLAMIGQTEITVPWNPVPDINK